MLEINKDILDYIEKCKITYNNEDHTIRFNGVEADEYEIRVILERLKFRFSFNIDKETLINILSDNNFYTIVNKNDELDEITKIIDEDDTIQKSDWEQYKEWKENDAIWRVDKDGIKTSIIDCFENIVGFIENFPKTKGKIKFNNIRNIVEYDGRQIVDGDYHTFINYINKYFIATFGKLKTIKEACDNVANKNKYNPWIDYFNNLEYVNDGIDYIDYTIKNVLCCEEQDKYYDLYYETLKIMFTGLMSRIYNKENNIATKFDSVITFCGENGGSGKTTFFERLFDLDNNGNSYCYVVAGDSFQPREKDFLERTHQCVCLLIDELTMKRSIVTSIKGYITQRDDRFRKAYAFNSEAHLRGFIITATSNNTDILKDYTTDNERRWLIVKISENTKNYINVNKAFDEGYRDKLWAFIKNLYENNEVKLFIDDDRLLSLESEIQRDYKASNNVDYNTIIDDLLEREYGYVDKDVIDVDFICQQYLYGDSNEWCKKHNNEIYTKISKSEEDKYIMRPEDKLIKYFGKIDRISKKTLFDILDRLRFEFTKVSLNAEMRYSGRWNGWCRGKNVCRINKQTINAYWRKNKSGVSKFVAYIEPENNQKTETYQVDGGLPF